MTTTVDTAAGRGLEPELEHFRVELTGYSYRMLGSSHDAEDAVQETMVRAWRGLDRFEGRSSLRSWLYRIATNVCLTMLEARGRRARPMDFGAPGTPEPSSLGEPKGEATWLAPVPDAMVVPLDGDPAELAVARETIKLAFVAALQHLPARQRAVLILREVLQWSAAETADLLGTTVVSVNSALQRARATLGTQASKLDAAPAAVGTVDQELIDRYADAFQRYDIPALVSLLHEDAVLSMPPYALWLRGRDDIAAWHLGPGAGCRGSRLLPVAVNGQPGFAQYKPDPTAGGLTAWSISVPEIADGSIVALNAFLDCPTLFPLFGLPLSLAG